MSDETDPEFERGLAFVLGSPPDRMPADCPRIVVTVPLEGPVFFDFKGDYGRLWDWLASRPPGLLELLEHGLALAREGRGE